MNESLALYVFHQRTEKGTSVMKNERTARIVFIPGICSDDGRALTGRWNIYLKGPRELYADCIGSAATEQEARDHCAKIGAPVSSVRAA